MTSRNIVDQVTW